MKIPKKQLNIYRALSSKRASPPAPVCPYHVNDEKVVFKRLGLPEIGADGTNTADYFGQIWKWKMDMECDYAKRERERFESHYGVKLPERKEASEVWVFYDWCERCPEERDERWFKPVRSIDKDYEMAVGNLCGYVHKCEALREYRRKCQRDGYEYTIKCETDPSALESCLLDIRVMQTVFLENEGDTLKSKEYEDHWERRLADPFHVQRERAVVAWCFRGEQDWGWLALQEEENAAAIQKVLSEQPSPSEDALAVERRRYGKSTLEHEERRTWAMSRLLGRGLESLSRDVTTGNAVAALDEAQKNAKIWCDDMRHNLDTLAEEEDA